MEKIMLQDFTRPAFEEYLEKNHDVVCLLTMGSIEQHGPHLPLGTDTYAVLATCKEVARRTGCFVVQPCWPGFSPHHLGFKGSLTFTAETLQKIYLEVIGSLSHHGVKRFIIVNGHGGNVPFIPYIVLKAKRDYGATVVNRRSFSVRARPVTKEERDAMVVRAAALSSHAGPGETSNVLVKNPELVEMDRIKGWKNTTTVPREIVKLVDVEYLKSLSEEEQVMAATLRRAYLPDSHILTSSGVWGSLDPNDTDLERARTQEERSIESIVKFIKMWREKIPV